MAENDSNDPSNGASSDPQTPPPYPGEQGSSAEPPPVGGGAGGSSGGNGGGENPLSDSETKLWAMLAHLLGIVCLFVAPLIIMLVQGPRSAFVEKHAKEALNFQIIVTIAFLVSFVLTGGCIGFFMLVGVAAANLIFCIIAGLEANKGNDYRYPFSYPFVK